MFANSIAAIILSENFISGDAKEQSNKKSCTEGSTYDLSAKTATELDYIGVNRKTYHKRKEKELYGYPDISYNPLIYQLQKKAS